MISAVLATQLSTERPDGDPIGPANCQTKRGQNPVLFGFLLVIFGAMLAVVGHKFLADKMVGDIGALVALLGMGLMGWRSLTLMSAQSRRSPRPKPTTREEVSASTPWALPSAEGPSITEHTTRQLEPSAESNADRPRTTQPTV